MSWAAVGWVVGAVVIVLLTVLVGDKATRRRVVRSVARRWERRSQRTSQARARAHVRSTRATSSRSLQARPRFERPKQSRLGVKKCSAACRTSRKPAFDRNGVLLCDCPCGGREHGMYKKGSTATPKAPKRAAGSSGTQRVAAGPSGRPSAPARRPIPRAAGPAKRATTGTIDTPKTPTVESSPIPAANNAGKPMLSSADVMGWQGLNATSRSKLESHARSSARCGGGTVTARTIKDNRTDPPTVSQDLTCDTCGKRL